jgi:PAS domain S-box-containing protein
MPCDAGQSREMAMARTYDGERSPPSKLNFQDDSGHDLSPQSAETAKNGKRDPGSIPPSLAALGIIELLESDSRPTFVVELNHIQGKPFLRTRVIYYNAPLLSCVALKELVSGTAVPESMSVAYNAYKGWFTELLQHSNSSNGTPYSFCGLLWTAFTMKRQFGIISGTPGPQSSDTGPRNIAQESEQVSSSQGGETRPDLINVTSNSSAELSFRRNGLPHHIQFFRNIDWTSTSLGPTGAWSPQLRQMITLLMSDPNPAFLFWTREDMILVYNEAAIVVVAEKHPHAQGRPGKESFAEVWEPFSGQFASVFTSRRALRHENMPAHLRRHGRMDECYVTYTYLPVIDDGGAVVGIYETFQDVTRQVLFGRRLSMLLEISTCSANVRETKLFWQRLLQALESNHNDVPFAILYSVDEIWHNDMKASGAMQLRSHKMCALEGLLGIPAGHVAAPAILDLEEGTEGYGSAFRKAMEIEDHVLLRREDGSLPESYVEGFACRGFGETCSSAVVCPIRPTGGKNIVGFLVLGLNPRQGYDEDGRQFIDILSRQIATSVAAVVLLDEEIRRGRKVAEDAAHDQAKLEQQLDMTNKELMKSENKFELMADDAPVGMVTADTSGRILYANKAWYDISGSPKTASDAESWLTLYEDPDFCQAMLLQLLTTGEPITIEACLKKPWVKEISNGEILRIPTWILVSADVDKFDDGSIKNFRATVTDISQQKWAEEIQKRRTDEAIVCTT